jgi:hypothetical protein
MMQVIMKPHSDIINVLHYFVLELFYELANIVFGDRNKFIFCFRMMALIYNFLDLSTRRIECCIMMYVFKNLLINVL